MKGKSIGTILLIIGIGAIITGIVLKRFFAMGEYLIAFHSVGGLLLVVGVSMLFLGRKPQS